MDYIISQKYQCGEFSSLDKSMIFPQISLCWGLISVHENIISHKYLTLESVDDNIVFHN